MSYAEEFIYYFKNQAGLDIEDLKKSFYDFKISEKRKSWDFYEEKNTFNLTQKHLDLLKNMQVNWDSTETGAPAIDPKRPYGNSDVANDVGNILGYKPRGFEGDPEEYSLKQCDKFLRIHRETQTALQIVLQTGDFKKGTYKREDSWSNWVKDEK